MCTIITFQKNLYVQNLPKLFTNQSHLSTKMTLHTHPCTIYLQQPYWEWSPINNQQSIPFPTTSYQLNMSTPPSILLHKNAIFLSFKLYIQSLWLTSTLSWRYHLPTQKIRSLNNTRAPNKIYRNKSKVWHLIHVIRLAMLYSHLTLSEYMQLIL